MPHIDSKSGELVIRIVYDGLPEAGKTTNVQELASLVSLQRRGVSKSPGALGERTEFFDWLDFAGGYLDGRRVRCQLVSVPGQANLLHRRRYLLEKADAVVFVADSRPSACEESIRSLRETVRILRLENRGTVGAAFILQANKQDLPDALSPQEVARAHAVELTTPVLGSIAATGVGVMQTFILAVRLASDRVRAIVLNDELADISDAERSPEALYAAMLQNEPPPPPAVALQRLDAIAGSTRASARPPRAPSAPPLFHPERENLLSNLQAVTLPNAQEICSGHVWPPVKGRAALALAMSSALSVPTRAAAWAPDGALELRGENGWILHSSQRWLFESEAEARLRLLSLVRKALPYKDVLPEGRSLLLARDGAHFRLWMVTPPIASLDQTAHRANAEGAAALHAFLERSVAGFEQLGLLGLLANAWPGGSSGLALQDERVVLLSLDEGEQGPSVTRGHPLRELGSLLAHTGIGRDKLTRWSSLERKFMTPNAPCEHEEAP
jgi:signal recognition particle receptor subunit beta